MKDYLGNELKVGDQVIFINTPLRCNTKNGHKEFAVGIIDKFTKLQIKVKFVVVAQGKKVREDFKYKDGHEVILLSAVGEK